MSYPQSIKLAALGAALVLPMVAASVEVAAEEVVVKLWSRADRSGPLRTGNIVAAAEPVNAALKAAGVDKTVRVEAFEGPATGYRYRARLSVRYVPKKGHVLVGFHERKSRYIADMQVCKVLPEKVSAMLLPLRELIGAMDGRDRLPQIDDEYRKPFRFLGHAVDRGRARQQEQQVRMTDPGDEHLLPVHDVTLALFHRDGLELGRVGAGGGFGHCHRLHAQLAARDLGQIGPLLIRRSVPQHASHNIHLAVHRAGKGARASPTAGRVPASTARFARHAREAAGAMAHAGGAAGSRRDPAAARAHAAHGALARR